MTNAMIGSAAHRDDAEIDFDKVIHDPVYRRAVIRRLNSDTCLVGGRAYSVTDAAVSESRVTENGTA